jgi:hypothetical protein
MKDLGFRIYDALIKNTAVLDITVTISYNIYLYQSMTLEASHYRESDFDTNAEQRGYNVWLEKRLGSLGLTVPLETDSNQPLVPGTLILLHDDAFTPRKRKTELRHVEAYHTKSSHVYIVTDNHDDPTGESGIIVNALRLEGENVYMASYTQLLLTVQYTKSQPDTNTHPYEYVAGFVDIRALEGMNLSNGTFPVKLNTGGIARFLDPTYGFLPLSEFVAQQRDKIQKRT